MPTSAHRGAGHDSGAGLSSCGGREGEGLCVGSRVVVEEAKGCDDLGVELAAAQAVDLVDCLFDAPGTGGAFVCEGVEHVGDDSRGEGDLVADEAMDRDVLARHEIGRCEVTRTWWSDNPRHACVCQVGSCGL
jgi:hypothetical protein